jgi:hypothetical protein
LLLLLLLLLLLFLGCCCCCSCPSILHLADDRTSALILALQATQCTHNPPGRSEAQSYARRSSQHRQGLAAFPHACRMQNGFACSFLLRLLFFPI